MFILKFFASLILLFFGIIILFVIFSFLIARKAMTDLNESLSDKFDGNSDNYSKAKQSNANIPSAIECKSCGTYYAEAPKNNICSCGAKL